MPATLFFVVYLQNKSNIMVIRKLFRFEGAHIVRNCTSERCRENIHGHSYIVEVFLTADRLDNGGMVMDFARLAPIKRLIDRFDHAFLLWKGEKPEFKKFVYTFNRRVVETPISPTSEGLALMFLKSADSLLSAMAPTNGENGVKVSSVRVHETATGYAEAFREDLPMATFRPSDLLFTDRQEQ